MSTRPGYTLIELAWVLLLGTFLLALATPAYRTGRDALATRAARDHLVQSVALARALAPLHAGAELVLEPPAARVLVCSGNQVHEDVSLAERYGVQLAVEGTSQPTIALSFDALGIGRLANRTITLRRGNARAGVSLSVYGRARAW